MTSHTRSLIVVSLIFYIFWGVPRIRLPLFNTETALIVLHRVDVSTRVDVKTGLTIEIDVLVIHEVSVVDERVGRTGFALGAGVVLQVNKLVIYVVVFGNDAVVLPNVLFGFKIVYFERIRYSFERVEVLVLQTTG